MASADEGLRALKSMAPREQTSGMRADFETLLAQVFEQAPSFMALVIGPEHVYELVNSKFYEFTHLRQDVLGKRVADVFPELGGQGFISLLDQVYRTGVPYHGSEVPLSLSAFAPKQQRFIDFVYQPLKDSSGKVYGIVAHGFDVTERVLSRRTIERSRTAFETERRNFLNLFRQTPEMVCILRGPNHVFEFVNEAHIRALGFDATGMSVREAQPESVEVHGLLDGVYRSGQTAELQETPVTLGDRLRYFNLTYSARRDQDGEIDGVMILGIEITDQVRARQSLLESDARLKFALASAGMGTWTIDLLKDEIILSNESGEIFGKPVLRNSVWQHIESSIHPEDRPAVTAKLKEALLSGGPYRSEHRLLRPDGQLRWVLSRGRARYDDLRRPTELSGVIIDITERKKAERRLEEAVRSRDEFLSVASHELKTPVTSLKMQLQMARRGVRPEEGVGPSPEKLARSLDMANRQVDRLVALVENLLDVSRVESGKMTYTFEKADLSGIVREVVERFADELVAAGARLSLSLPEKLFACCDRLRIEQLVTNLVTNAIKYGARSPIEVTLVESCEGAVLKVSDRGIGIAPDKQSRIFDRFERAVSHRNISGLGLGLYISKEIVTAHHGRILLESAEGKGSTFTVILPSIRSADSTHAEP